jgi:hypothetical protein
MAIAIDSYQAGPTNLQTMRALFAKDWRFFRVPMLALIISAAASYLLIVGDALVFGQTMARDANPAAYHRLIVDSIGGGAAFSAVLTVLIAAAFGGTAIAAERADRTADFLGLMPVTRMQVVLSKWFASFCMLGVWLLFQGAVAWVAVRALSKYSPDNHQDILNAVGLFAALALCTFGVAWLFGSFTRSGPISACLGIAATAIACFLPEAVDHQHRPGELQLWTAATVAMIGMCGLLAGTVIYLRRIAP